MQDGNVAKAKGHEEKILVIHATKRKKCELTLPDKLFQTVQAAGTKLGADSGFARDYTNAIKSAMGFKWIKGNHA